MADNNGGMSPVVMLLDMFEVARLGERGVVPVQLAHPSVKDAR